MVCIITANMYNKRMYLNWSNKCPKWRSECENAQLWKYVLTMYLHNVKTIKRYLRTIFHSFIIGYILQVSSIITRMKISKMGINWNIKVIKGKRKSKANLQSVHHDVLCRCNVYKCKMSMKCLSDVDLCIGHLSLSIVYVCLYRTKEPVWRRE